MWDRMICLIYALVIIDNGHLFRRNVLVWLLVSYANHTYGTIGIYISSSISALTDIDAKTISLSKLAENTLEVLIAENAILLATFSNYVVKIGFLVLNL